MIPKVEACLESLHGGVRKTHIIDGRLRHSLLLEIYTDRGVGTEIVLQRQPENPEPKPRIHQPSQNQMTPNLRRDHRAV